MNTSTFSILSRLGLACWLVLVAGTAVATPAASCPPAGHSKASLLALKTKQFKLDDASQAPTLALALLPCLSDPDPLLRDEIGFEALQALMRNNQLNQPTLYQLRSALLQQLKPDPNDQQGFAQPFAALMLAEVARADRKQPFLSPQERQQMVDAASTFLTSVRDYRGFDEKSGWRHGVAHGADFMLQLALNPALERAQQETILTALLSQIAPAKHAYQYSEGERLMAPLYYLAMRAPLSGTDWQAWFTRLLAPFKAAPQNTQAKLTLRHNLNGFLLPLYFTLQESSDAEVRKKLLPAVVLALKELG
ncbi:MAG: hypothetical protein RL748_404 [Pseudomonadota bacterium]